MEKILKDQIAYVRENKKAVYSDEKIMVDGRPYFFVLKINEDKNTFSNKFTIRKHHKCLIVTNYNEILFVENRLWKDCTDKNRNFDLNKETREIKIAS